MENKAQYGVSKRGNETLLFKGYEFWRHRVLKSGSVVWRCSKHQSCKCKATIIEKDLIVVGGMHESHTHGGNNSRSLARRAVGEMKRRLVDTLAAPSTTQAAVMQNLSNDVLMALPKKSTLSRALRQHRQRVNGAAEQILPPIPTDATFVTPDRFTSFVLFDSGPADNDRLILFGCNELLDGLARATIWLADGTFKVVPEIFFQLYTIHFQFNHGVNPAAVYCLTKNKTRATYDRLLDEIVRQIPTAAPSVILTDFESAAMGSFHNRFPTARITGCYFHLSQSVLRKVNEVGLKTAYETQDDVRIYVRCLAALSHVPVNDVPEAFDLLANSMADVEHLDEVVTYFEHTYIRGRRLRGRAENYRPATFPPEVWNQFDAAGDGICRTNNICEGWHHGLQSLLQSSHPTMWRFIEGLQRDCTKQKHSFLQVATGVEQPAEKRYKNLRERLQRAVASYGQTEGLTYLRAIACLSYQ